MRYHGHEDLALTLDTHSELLEWPRNVHDDTNPKEWESELAKVAEMFELTIPETPHAEKPVGFY